MDRTCPLHVIYQRRRRQAVPEISPSFEWKYDPPWKNSTFPVIRKGNNKINPCLASIFQPIAVWGPFVHVLVFIFSLIRYLDRKHSPRPQQREYTLILLFLWTSLELNYVYILYIVVSKVRMLKQQLCINLTSTIILLSLRSLLLRLAAVIEYRWVLKYKLLVQFFGPIFRSKKNIEKKIQIWVASVWYIVANFCPNWAIYKNGAPGAFLDKLKIRWRITTAIFCEELNVYSVNIWVIFSNYNSHDVYSVCANSL